MRNAYKILVLRVPKGRRKPRIGRLVPKSIRESIKNVSSSTPASK